MSRVARGGFRPRAVRSTRSGVDQWLARVREQIAGIAAAVTALFLVTFGVPSAGVYYHTHAGGEHAHVHADDESGLAELLAEYRHDHDHEHHDHGHPHDHPVVNARSSRAAASDTALEDDDGPVTGHWHQQDRFQRAVSPAIFTAHHVEPVQFTPGRPEPAPVDRPALPVRARGPPFLRSTAG